MHTSLLYIKIFRRETTIKTLSQENFKKYILDDLVTAKGSFKLLLNINNDKD